MPRFRTAILFAIALALAGAVMLHLTVCSNSEVLADNDVVASGFRSELARLATEQAALQERMNSLQQQVFQAQAALRTAGIELQLAQARANPSLATLLPLARQQIEAGVIAGTEPPVRAPFTILRSDDLNGSIAARRPDERRQRISVESSHGWFLDNLGITDPRREEILQALAKAMVERNIVGAMQREGRLNAEDARQQLEQLDDEAVLAAPLTESERVRLPELERGVAERTQRRAAEIQLLTTFKMEPVAANHVAQVYARHFVNKEVNDFPAAERANVVRDVAEDTRQELAATMNADEMEQVALFLEEQVILTERMAGRAQ